MMSSPARHKHLQLDKVSMDPDSFALFPVSSAAFQRCPPRGCMMALVVPSTSFPSAASRAGRKGGHFLLISIYTPFIFLIKKSPVDVSLHLIGHMTLAVGESGRASPPGNYGPFGEFVPTIRQEREE